MTAIVVDPGGMRAAAVVLDGYLDALELSVRALDAVTLPAGVPPAQQALVSRALSTARLDLLGALRMITGLPARDRRAGSIRCGSGDSCVGGGTVACGGSAGCPPVAG